LDLLQKIGVELTYRAKTELWWKLCLTIYQAAAFAPSLLEAAARAGVMSADISRGNIGVNVRNDIQRRKE
jgi:hypothetical protein